MHHTSASHAHRYRGALRKTKLSLDIVEGTERITVTEEYDIARCIENIVEFARSLSASIAWNFPVPDGKAGLLQHPYAALAACLRFTPDDLLAAFPNHMFHPYVYGFVKGAIEHHLYDWDWNMPSYSLQELRALAKACGGMLRDFQSRSTQATQKALVKRHTDEVRRNVKSVEAYVSAVFDYRYRRVLAIRVDLCYRANITAARDWKMARCHREAMIAYINKDLPLDILSSGRKVKGEEPETNLSYVIGTEYTADSGWHFHVTLLLNGDRHQSDVNISRLILAIWIHRITEGEGRGNSCNLNKENYVRLGIGMIDEGDSTKRKLLVEDIATYGCKGCYFARAMTSKGDRLLNKGISPKKLGRRRRPEGVRSETPSLIRL